MTRWAAFVGLLVIVLLLLLSLARLSQNAISTDAGDDVQLRVAEQASRDPRPADPVIPRFEERSPDVRTTLSPAALLANVALTQGLFGGVVLGGAVYFAIPLSAFGVPETPLARGLPGVGVGIAFGLLLWLGNEAAGVLADALGASYDESLRSMLAPESTRGWVLLLGAVLPTVAAVEEIIFRGAAIGVVQAAGFGVPVWALVLLSSVAFGAAHGAQGRVGMVVTGGLGVALAVGFVLTKSLLVVVVAHYLVNALELVVHEGLGYDRVAVDGLDDTV